MTDPRNGERVALKKMPNIFQNIITAKRVYSELRMLCSFRHDNVLAARDVLVPSSPDAFDELYVLMPLMQSDLHKIIVSSQILTMDHIKVGVQFLCLFSVYARLDTLYIPYGLVHFVCSEIIFRLYIGVRS